MLEHSTLEALSACDCAYDLVSVLQLLWLRLSLARYPEPNANGLEQEQVDYLLGDQSVLCLRGPKWRLKGTPY